MTRACWNCGLLVTDVKFCSVECRRSYQSEHSEDRCEKSGVRSEMGEEIVIGQLSLVKQCSATSEKKRIIELWSNRMME